MVSPASAVNWCASPDIFLMQTLALDAMLMAGDQRDVGLKTEPMGYDQRESVCVSSSVPKSSSPFVADFN